MLVLISSVFSFLLVFAFAKTIDLQAQQELICLDSPLPNFRNGYCLANIASIRALVFISSAGFEEQRQCLRERSIYSYDRIPFVLSLRGKHSYACISFFAFFFAHQRLLCCQHCKHPVCSLSFCLCSTKTLMLAFISSSLRGAKTISCEHSLYLYARIHFFCSSRIEDSYACIQFLCLGSSKTIVLVSIASTRMLAFIALKSFYTRNTLRETWTGLPRGHRAIILVSSCRVNYAVRRWKGKIRFLLPSHAFRLRVVGSTC
jgi:hypothetical protein